MLTISRKFTKSPNLKYLGNLRRTVSSGRFPQLLSQDTLQNTSNDEPQKGGYGEKEIILLGPVDIRAPLPGNMGIPHAFLYTDKVSPLPKQAGVKCDLLTSSIPEERYRNLLTEVTRAATENSLSTYAVEWMCFDCPQLLKKDFSDLFPSRNIDSEAFTVITLCQKTKNDMSEWSEDAEKERIGLETCFVAAATAICAGLNVFNYWADFIHPNSGKPNFDSLTNATMYDTDSRYRHFGFSIEDLGCCKIIAHKKWGTHFFVGSIFTNASLQSQVIETVLRNVDVNPLFRGVC